MSLAACSSPCRYVVGDAARTRELFVVWAPRVRAYGYPLAYVLQDGVDVLPWHEVDAVFVGGTTEFKLSATARRCVHEAKMRGKWVHMGRVNSRRRLREAEAMGVDSVDGTYVSRWPKVGLPRMTAWIGWLKSQQRLF
jgi:hypothetical protein